MSDIVFGGADQEDFAAAKQRLRLVANNPFVEVEGGVCWRCHTELPDWAPPWEPVCDDCYEIINEMVDAPDD